MKYKKIFKDTVTGVEYYISECCTDIVSGDLRRLVLVGIDQDSVVEASVDYDGIMIEQDSCINGSVMEIGAMEFNDRFVVVKE